MAVTALAPPVVEAETTEVGSRSATDRRRFAAAAAIGIAVVTPLWLWAACDLWSGRFIFDRYLPYEANFFDLQGRALLHGHLWLQDGSIGIEAFTHSGHEYTYFGLFPSLIRLPILAVTSSLDAHLTVPSMLLAWLVIGLSTSLLVWRVRCQLRGDALLGRGELLSLGAFVATVCGGSVLVYLAATPYVFDEDLAWSVALTLSSFFMLLGVLERPSGRRILWCGLLITAANLDRVTTGVACAAGALLLAGWFLIGRAGQDSRRFAVPLALAGALPLILAAAINLAKFGMVFGLPMQDQVFSQVNAYRRQFLAANGGEVGLQFAPSDLLAYLRPDALRISTVFPFVTLPSSPAGTVGHVLFDRTYATTSVPTSMPLLFLAACFGLFSCLRPRPASAAARGIGLLALAAGISAGAIVLWGYIADRYLADFLPVLVLAGAVGVVELWRALEGRSRRWRLTAGACIAGLAIFGVVVNTSISATPNEEWNTTQVANFVSAQASASPTSLSGRVEHGAQLPAWAPAGTLFEVGDCQALYISNGEDFSTVPLQAYEHATWMAADEGSPYRRVLRLAFVTGSARPTRLVPLVTAGPSTVAVELGAGQVKGVPALRFVLEDPSTPVDSALVTLSPGAVEAVSLITDPQLHKVRLEMNGVTYLNSVFTGGAAISVAAAPAGSPVVVTDVSNPRAEDSLCRRVTGS